MKIKNWTLSTLKEKLEYYQRLLANTNDYQEQETLKEIIESYEDFVYNYTAIPQKTNFAKAKKRDLSYLKNIKEILPIILEANNILVSNNIKLPKKLMSINTSKEQILKTTSQFYSSIGGIFKDIYDDYYNTNAIYINFMNGYNDCQSGTILRPHGVQECFINIMLFNNPYDIATSIHEHSHAIAASIFEDHLDNNLLSEVDAIFFELLFTDSLSKENYEPEQIKNFKEVTINTRNNLLNAIDVKNIILNQNIQDINTIRKIVKEKYYIDDDEINNMIYSSLSSNIKYALSYLIAIELYYIYKRCDFKALSILEEIINIDEDDEFIVLKLLQEFGIYPGNNFKRFNTEYIKGISK